MVILHSLRVVLSVTVTLTCDVRHNAITKVTLDRKVYGPKKGWNLRFSDNIRATEILPCARLQGYRGTAKTGDGELGKLVCNSRMRVLA